MTDQDQQVRPSAAAQKIDEIAEIAISEDQLTAGDTFERMLLILGQRVVDAEAAEDYREVHELESVLNEIRTAFEQIQQEDADADPTQ